MFIPSTFKRPVSSWKALNLRKTLLMASSVRLKPLNCFFSSRRRHTRSLRDWSSDVCSSDLRAARWCLDNGRPEEALGYLMAAEDVGAVVRLVEQLALPAFRQARLTTIQRWFAWLDGRDGIEGHPMAAVWASILAAQVGRPAEAERWAGVVDRWQQRGEA